jgi:hypothetical protein
MSQSNIFLRAMRPIYLADKTDKSMYFFLLEHLKTYSWTGMVVHICNPSTQEIKVVGSQVQGQPGLHIEFKSSLHV